MPQVSVRIDGNVKVGRGLAALGKAIETITDEELTAGIEQAAIDARGGWPNGPFSGYKISPPGGSKYVRTGNLGRSTMWEISGLSYRIKSNAYTEKGQAYSVFVLGDGTGAGQAGVHVGRWPLIFDVAMKWAKTLIKRIDTGIGRAARQEGIGL